MILIDFLLFKDPEPGFFFPDPGDRTVPVPFDPDPQHCVYKYIYRIGAVIIHYLELFLIDVFKIK